MKLFSVSQIKAWDSYTIRHEPVKSIDLMERAAVACSDWLSQYYGRKTTFFIFCGRGNNGGDGLAIARLLAAKRHPVAVFLLNGTAPGSPGFEINFKRLNKTCDAIGILKEEHLLPVPPGKAVVIDALFGTGLNKKPAGLAAALIRHINTLPNETVSIDVPSGLFIEKTSMENEVIKASHTLSFGNPKLSFLMAENQAFTGKVSLLDIGLSREYEENQKVQFQLVDPEVIRRIFRPRNKFAHKGDFGHACLIAGSYGMMGAGVLSASACLRSGAGKLTCLVGESGYSIMQTAVPEAMCRVSGSAYFSLPATFKDFDAVGIGPGIGQHDSHVALLKELFSTFQHPVVIDADALNVVSKNSALYTLIPAESVLTPHPREFERLFGKTGSDFDRISLALQKAAELNLYILVKGHYTFIATPGGVGYFNSTGNAGMATAGSGDVLTGIITGLLAQKYTPEDACILGVYLHGVAGDIAASQFSKEAMVAGDIYKCLGDAFLKMNSES